MHCLKSLLGARAWNPQVRCGSNFDILYVMARLKLAFHSEEMYKLVDKNMEAGMFLSFCLEGPGSGVLE